MAKTVKYAGHAIVETPNGERITANVYQPYYGQPSDSQVKEDLEKEVLKKAPAGSRVISGRVDRVS